MTQVARQSAFVDERLEQGLARGGRRREALERGEERQTGPIAELDEVHRRHPAFSELAQHAVLAELLALRSAGSHARIVRDLRLSRDAHEGVGAAELGGVALRTDLRTDQDVV